MRLSILLMLGGVLAACGGPSPSPAATTIDDQDSLEEVVLDVTPFDPVGDWILTEFHDSILENRQIGAYRRPVPIWSALLLRVGHDSIHLYGTISKRSLPRTMGDTILRYVDFANMVVFADARSGRLVVQWKDDRSPPRSGVLHYRRLDASEGGMTDSLDRNPWSLRDNYHLHLQGALFAGQYTEIGGSTSFRLTPEGGLSGQTTWVRFDFHDYFGTLHPYRDDMDALRFTDKGNVVHSFNWRFSRDTLVLTRLGTNGDEYWLEPGEMRFLKN